MSSTDRNTTSIAPIATPLPASPDGQAVEQAECVAPHAESTVGAAHRSKIMLVDDEEFNILMLRRHLRDAGFENFITTVESPEAIGLMRQHLPDILLLDVMMPKMNGLEVLAAVRKDAMLKRTPVIVLTASSDASIKLQALELGATDFLSKPVDASELILRVRNTLTVKAHQDYLSNYSSELERQVRLRTAELEASQREVVYCLARAAESRDEQTGHHVVRVGLYVGVIADQLGFSDHEIEMLQLAAQLHDVGKIGVSDLILRKPASLDPEEYEQIKQHCDFGRKIIEPEITASPDQFRQHTQVGADLGVDCTSPLLKLAASIAGTHHEKWDGSGYPLGLAGESIPIEGRMTAVADVFDALTNRRPYKEAFPVEKALQIISESRGTHFDPQVLDAFMARMTDIVQILENYSDS